MKKTMISLLVLLALAISFPVYAGGGDLKLELNNKRVLGEGDIISVDGTSYVDSFSLSRILGLDFYWRGLSNKLVIRTVKDDKEVFLYFSPEKPDYLATTSVSSQLAADTNEDLDKEEEKTYEVLGYLTTEMLDEEELKAKGDSKSAAEKSTELEKAVHRGIYLNREDKIYIPIKTIAEHLGYTVKWDSFTRSVLLYTVDESTLPKREVLRMNYTEEDLLLLARIAHVEAKDGSENKQLAVANVVLNRVEHPEFANTIKDVIYAPNQFPPAHKESFASLVPTAVAFNAAKRALHGDNNVPNVLYFNMVPFPSKSKSEFFGEIEGDYFYY